MKQQELYKEPILQRVIQEMKNLMSVDWYVRGFLIPGRADLFTRRRKPLGSSAEQTEGLRLGRADFCVGKTGHIFCREVSAAGKTFMREDDHSRSLERVPGQFSPIRAKKPVYTKISDGSRRVFYILESSSINYLKKRRWYYYVNWNWRKFNRLFWFCKR